MRFVILKFAFDNGAIVESFLALTVFEIIFELTDVNAIIESELTLTVFFSVFKLADVDIDIGVN